MSTQDQIDRIKQNVANTYAVLSALGADMPEEQTSDNLATTAGSAKAVLYSAQSLTEAQKAQARENIGVTADGDTIIPPLKIYAKLNENGLSYTQEIIEGGAAKTYTAAEIHDLVSQRIVTVETYTDINTSAGRGLHQYFETTYASDGTVNQVVFRGVYVNALYKLVPAYVTINHLGNVFVSDVDWSGGSVETDTTLTKNGYPADAKKVGDKLTALSEQIANSGGTSGGASINVTAEVGQTIVVKEVDADGKPTAWKAAEYQPRTHWSESVEILPETTVEVDPTDGVGVITGDFVLEVGKSYTIKYNGVEYAGCVGFDAGEGNVGFGNMGAVNESFPATEHPFVMVYMEIDSDGDGVIERGVMILPLDGAESVTLSIAGAVYHPIPSEYVPYALPYYINLSVVYSDDGSIESATCNETVSQLEVMYRSGRTLVLQYKKQEETGAGDGGTITNIYEYRWQLAIAASSPLYPGIVFQFTSPSVRNTSGGADVTPICTLQPNEDGTYTVTFMGMG